jgi:hypothetical protein
VNLAFSDLLVTLVCMPMAISTSVTAIWFYGLFMCKFSVYLQGMKRLSQIIFMNFDATEALS